MSLQDVELKSEYRSLVDNVAREFYIPLLKESVIYKRAVGFFSSSALVEISKGIFSLVQNGGTIQLIASPYLSDDDIEAIKKGYEMRDIIIENALLRELHKVNSEMEQERLNLLANLIAEGVLDVKVALTKQNNKLGMYHEKMGIIADSEGNKVAFSGSMNESFTAMAINYEAIDVFCSWQDDCERVNLKEKAFDAMWNNTDSYVVTIEFPNVKDEIIKRYRKDSITDPDKIEFGDDVYISGKSSKCWMSKPSHLEFYDYQIDAIASWKKEKFRGIFDMATGTGKTYTALGALEMLSNELEYNLGVFIVCPYQHLVEQWVTDIKAFGITPLICYARYNWKKKYKSIIDSFNLRVRQNFCIVTTNATFATDNMQREIDKLSGNICIIVDEAHNFGAKRQLECMKDVFNYRFIRMDIFIAFKYAYQFLG